MTCLTTATVVHVHDPLTTIGNKETLGRNPDEMFHWCTRCIAQILTLWRRSFL